MTLLDLAKLEIPGLRSITSSFVNEHGANVYIFDRGDACITVLGGSFLVVENPSSLQRRTVRRGTFNELSETVDIPIVSVHGKSLLRRVLDKFKLKAPSQN